MTRLSLVRHGQTDWNVQRRIQGASDIPLNDAGRQQALAAGRALALRSWDGIFASPLSRAMDTARIIAAETGLGEPQPIAEVAERRYGDAEGLTGEEILARFPEGVPVPGQETRDEVVARALPALDELAAANLGRSLIIVSHGGVIASLVRRLTNHALPAPGEVIPNGSVHDFVYRDGSLQLDRFNLSPEDHDLFTAAVS
ncbi:MAG TPA: histidine phosphatase family protein [Microbacteriaceae bacterium]|nr:histidine phosphatase family protein [Microbacteriaceae bacterium]